MAERLASFDYLGLGRVLRPSLEQDGRGWRACGDEIGVSASDISRVMAGQAVAAHKAIAICDWLGIDLRRFYRPGCFTVNTLKQEPRAKAVFHDAHTETRDGR